MLLEPALLPEDAFTVALHHLVEDPASFEELAGATADARLGARWPAVLRAELLELQRWTLARLLAASRGDAGGRVRPARVVSLLPRYGVALHALRRAVPFAALGIPTLAGIHPASPQGAREAVAAIAAGLEVPLRPFLSPGSPGTLDREGDLVVVTGRRSSVEAVRQRRSGPTLGATGRCGLVVSRDASATRVLVEVLCRHTALPSCTAIRAGLTVAQRGPGAGATPPGLVEADELRSVVRRLHPSAVFCPEPDAGAVRRLTDYEVLACDPTGVVPAGLAGLARDPRFGWPGDYRV